jgi:hypothetical protein
MLRRRLLTALAFYVALVAISAALGALRSWAALCAAAAIVAAAINLIANIDGCISFAQRWLGRTSTDSEDPQEANQAEHRRKAFFMHPDPAMRAGRIAIVGLVFGVPSIFYAQAVVRSLNAPEEERGRAIATLPLHEIESSSPVEEKALPLVIVPLPPQPQFPQEIAEKLKEISAKLDEQKARKLEEAVPRVVQASGDPEIAPEPHSAIALAAEPELPKPPMPVELPVIKEADSPQEFDNTKVVVFSFPKKARSRKIENQVEETQAIVEISGVTYRLWIQTPGYEFVPGAQEFGQRQAAGIAWCGAGKPSRRTVEMNVYKLASRGWVPAELNFDGIDTAIYEIEHGPEGPPLVTVEKKGFRSLSQR